MNCLLTGGAGFLGAHIHKALSDDGNTITQITRQQGALPDGLTISCDLASAIPDLGQRTIEKVVHVAGKAHSVPRTREEEAAFYKTNETGVKHLLAALEDQAANLRTFVNISTVAVYGCDTGEMISEGHPLNPATPYGISKARGEELVADWCGKKGISFYNLRLPLVAGNHPPGNLGKMIDAIKKGYYLKLKGNTARKSMVLAADVAKLVVALKDQPGGAYNLTDGYHPLVSEVEDALELALKKKIKFRLSTHTVETIASIGKLAKINRLDDIYRKLTATLTFSDDKARKELDWKPENVLNYLQKIKS